ncbi:MAG: hypothetical protein V4727_08395 [Verrucomicrobiota bacterium]
MPRFKQISIKQGIALPMTLMSIGALLLLLVGMLTILGLEGKTARSYSDATRAELALESGLATALAVISEISCRDDSLVFRIDDPVQPNIASDQRPLGSREQFFTYGAIFENNAWQAIPLFSNAQRQSLGARQIDARELRPQLSEYAASAQILIPITEHDQNIPRAQWIEIPKNPDQPTAPTLRFAFWIEDLSGRIDGKHVGKETRDQSFSTAEIDPTTIFDPASSYGNMPQVLDEKRDSLRTSASLRHLLDKTAVSRIEPYIAYLPARSHFPKMIPHGFGYADAGKPAPDLNSFVTAGDVSALSDHIARNLPHFSNRRGGFPVSHDYLKTIAASIIDYADTNSDPTIGIGYRGIDSYPFVNELFDRYEWIGMSDGKIYIKVETFVELWNPSQLPISGEIRFTNINRHKIIIPPAGSHGFSPVEFPPLNLTMPPNGFLVVPIGEHIHAFPAGSFPPSQLNFTETFESNYSLKWNNLEVDFARGGLQRTSGLLRAGSGERKWKGNASPAHDTSIGQLGDPRASIYINSPIIANSYDANSNWGGRALKHGIAAIKPTLPYAEVRINQWPDRGSSSLPGVRPVGDQRRPGTTSIMNPDGTPYVNGIYPTNQPDRAPTFISNSGRYDSLCELGNIFDPAQWSDVHSRNSTASSKAGGGFSLAIGRPEFIVFDTEGQRAAQLIDLFSLTPKNPHARRININTAPREVLRCLIAGVELKADPMAPEASPRYEESIGDLFADRVIAHRNQSPLRGYSDLNILRENPLEPRDPADPKDTPFFGNTDYFEQVPKVTNNDNPNDLIEWNDSGREELMRKVMDLVTFHSKTFRIVVAGEVLSKSGKRLARATREFHLTVEPERDANGQANPSGKPRITMHYESSH